MKYNVHTLPNGIRVVHIPSTNQVCYCGLIVNTGSRDEEPAQFGMAHFIEHTIFKGTQRRKAYHILSRLDEVGGELNAYTTKEETVIHAAFLSKDFARAVDLIADMVFNSTFPEKELQKEKEVIADEISSYKDTPSDLIFDDFERIMYADEAFGHDILGTAESIATFDGNMAKQFMAQRYNTDNMVFSVLGDMKWEKVVSTTEKYFGHIAENRRTWKREKPTFTQRETQKISKDTNQCHVVMGNVAPDAFDRRRLPMHIINSILGGPSMNSRLNLVLREKNGIAYNVETEYTAFSDTGLFTLYFGTDSANINRSLRIVTRELTRLCTTPFTDSELKKIKRQIIGQLLMSTDDGEEQMLSVGRSILLYNEANDIETSIRNIETVTADDLHTIAQEIIDPTLLSTLIYY